MLVMRVLELQNDFASDRLVFQSGFVKLAFESRNLFLVGCAYPRMVVVGVQELEIFVVAVAALTRAPS